MELKVLLLNKIAYEAGAENSESDFWVSPPLQVKPGESKRRKTGSLTEQESGAKTRSAQPYKLRLRLIAVRRLNKQLQAARGFDPQPDEAGGFVEPP